VHKLFTLNPAPTKHRGNGNLGDDASAIMDRAAGCAAC
jgi:hypothetical protein